MKKKTKKKKKSVKKYKSVEEILKEIDNSDLSGIGIGLKDD